MDILLIMLLIWGYNGQPKDAKAEEPVIVPIQEIVVPAEAVDVTQVTQTAAVLTAVATVHAITHAEPTAEPSAAAGWLENQLQAHTIPAWPPRRWQWA